MVAEWARLVNTTITNHMRTVEENTFRNRKLLAVLKKRGRLKFNCSGKKFDWRVLYKQAPLEGYADGDTLTFVRRNRWQTANLDYRGYTISESVSKFERLANRGNEQIVNLWTDTIEAVGSDIEQRFGDEMYIDGNATGNGKRIHGLESFLAKDASANGDSLRTVDPNDSYAGLSTALGNISGSWTGDWPAGTGDSEYDFWSPILVNVTNTVWGAASTWALFADDQVRYGIMKHQQNKYMPGGMDMILCDNTFFYQFKSLIDNKERIIVDRGKGQGLVSLGFLDVVNFDGVDITWEYGVPASTAYGMAVSQMELRSMQGKLFETDGPEFEQVNRSYNFTVDFLGNLRCNPRGFVKWYGYS